MSIIIDPKRFPTLAEMERAGMEVQTGREEILCPICDGTGKALDFPCRPCGRCAGRGKAQITKFRLASHAEQITDQFESLALLEAHVYGRKKNILIGR